MLGKSPTQPSVSAPRACIHNIFGQFYGLVDTEKNWFYSTLAQHSMLIPKTETTIAFTDRCLFLPKMKTTSTYCSSKYQFVHFRHLGLDKHLLVML
jgi:hypothetical protein